MFARRLARDGYGLILVARRADRLEALARELGGAETIAADLTSEDGLALVEQRIASARNWSCSSTTRASAPRESSTRRRSAGQEAMYRLHVIATMRLTRAALAAMVPRGRGGVINVSSVAGFGQSPDNVSYCTTKAWMNSFTEGLDLELKSAGSPVRVQALCPGFTVTEFHDAMGMSRDGIPGWMWMRAEDVVDASLRGLERGKVFVVPGALYKIIVVLEKLVPRRIRSAVVIRAGKAAAAKARKGRP